MRRENYFYYAHYYAAQAMWQSGGKRFARWFPAARDELVAKQQEDGSWIAPAEGNECATAMALHSSANAEQLFADISAIRMT